jgi:hypothetical protein
MSDELRLPATRTLVSAQEMSDALAVAWRRYFGREPVFHAIRVLLAQWALETGRGKSMIAFNCGGIKATENELHCYYTTPERLPRTQALAMLARSTPRAPVTLASADDGGPFINILLHPSHPGCRFRAYKTLEDGALDYLALLRQRFERSWAAVVAGEPRTFARMLKSQGYYTGNENDYAAALASLFVEYSKLRPPVPPAEVVAEDPREMPTAPDLTRIDHTKLEGIVDAAVEEYWRSGTVGGRDGEGQA